MSEDGVESLLSDFPVKISVPVAWGDMDAFAHVNNTVYLRYFESVRIAYFEHIGFISNPESMKIGPILAATDCRFKLPLAYPDTVRIGARVSEIGTDQFTMIYCIVSERHQRVAAQGSGRVVVFNYVDKQKTALPDRIRQRIEELEKR